jgi:mRNA interferase MazF
VWSATFAAVGSLHAKKRACVIVQRDAANATSPTTIVCPVTDARGRKTGLTNVPVAVGTAGLTKGSVIVCNEVRAIERSRLEGRLGRLGPEELAAVDRGLRAILDL